MADRSEIVDLYERDLRGFKSFTGLTMENFRKRHGLSRNVFWKLSQGYSASLATIERMYDAMDDSGFFSERRKEQWLIREARAGNIEKADQMVRQLASERQV